MEMENSNLKESIAGLNMLKKDAQKTMKKGLPFVLASVVIWGLILVVQSLDLDLSVKNMCTFVCCVLLMPAGHPVLKCRRGGYFPEDSQSGQQTGAPQHPEPVPVHSYCHVGFQPGSGIYGDGLCHGLRRASPALQLGV